MKHLLPAVSRERLYRAALRWCRRLLPETMWADRLYALVEFIEHRRRFPEKAPRRYSDRLFALRTGGALYDPLRQFVTDKEFVKLYVAATVGARYNVRTFRILRTTDDVEALTLDRFPCVLKPTNGAGRIRICTDADDLPDVETLRRWLDLDFYEESREQNYRYLRQKIIVEEFMTEDGRTPAPDYRIYCFHGRPGFIQVDSLAEMDSRYRLSRFHGRPGFIEMESGLFPGYWMSLYDPDWRLMPVSTRVPRGSGEDARPPMLDRMLDLAARLSAPFDFIRVDLYATATDLRVGELTNLPGGGRLRVAPPEAEFLVGRLFERR